MKKCSDPACRWCLAPGQPLALRSSADVAAYLRCHDQRFPPLITKLAGLRVQFERASNARV